MKWFLAAFLVAHGVAHLVGFVGAWRLSEAVPPLTTWLGGRINLGEAAVRAVGVAWLLAALAFAGVALAVALRLPWWLPATAAVAAASLMLAGLSWPEARVGVYIDLVLLAFCLGFQASGRFLP